MLQAAATAMVLFALWLLLTQRWSGGIDLVLAGGAALACTLVSWRLVGLRGAGFERAPQLLALAVSRLLYVVRGVWATLRAALAADVTLRPALVRVRSQPAREQAGAAFANAMSAAPGAIVIDSDGEGLLAHVIDEDAVDAVRLGALEARAHAAAGERLKR